MDLDSFFVSVERLQNSALNNRPVIIGGLSDRGVVASCSYEARRYGVHSAMPMKQARLLCPDAIFIRGDSQRYSDYSHMVTEVIAETVPLYEKSSIDEFYIDMSGMERFFGNWKLSQELKERIKKETGLPISFGLSTNKTVSKVATGTAKPAGQKQVPRLKTIQRKTALRI
jgi:DNA polymerase-4